MIDNSKIAPLERRVERLENQDQKILRSPPKVEAVDNEEDE